MDWIRQIEEDNRHLRDDAAKTDQALKEAVELLDKLRTTAATTLMHMNDDDDDWSAVMACKDVMEKASQFITAHQVKTNGNGHKPDLAELETRLGVANKALELVDEEARPLIGRYAFLHHDPDAIDLADRLAPLLNEWRSFIRREVEQ